MYSKRNTDKKKKNNINNFNDAQTAYLKIKKNGKI